MKKQFAIVCLLSLMIPAISFASRGGNSGGGTFAPPITTCAEAINYTVDMGRYLGHADEQLKQTLRQGEDPTADYAQIEERLEKVREAIAIARTLCNQAPK